MQSTSSSSPSDSAFAFAGAECDRLGNARKFPPTTPTKGATTIGEKHRKKTWRLLRRVKRRRLALLHSMQSQDPDHPHCQTLERHRSWRCCSYAQYGKTAGIGLRDGKAGVVGVQRCSHVWACKVCAPGILFRRQEEIQIAFDVAVENNYTVVFITLTFPHRRTYTPTDLIFWAENAREIYGKGGGRSRREKRLGYMGQIVRHEVTDGPNGIHPHYHILTFFNRELIDEEINNYFEYLKAKWTQACRQAGLVDDSNAAAFAAHGFHAERVEVERSDKIAKYMAKMAFSQEMTNAGNNKKSKKSKRKGRTMWDVLEGFACGDPADTEKWLSYLEAIQGKKAVRWSPGLKRKLGVDVLEDEQIVEAEEKEQNTRVYDIHNYYQVVYRGLWYPIMRAVETKNFNMLSNIAKKYRIGFTSVADGWPDITPWDDIRRPHQIQKSIEQHKIQ